MMMMVMMMMMLTMMKMKLRMEMKTSLQCRKGDLRRDATALVFNEECQFNLQRSPSMVDPMTRVPPMTAHASFARQYGVDEGPCVLAIFLMWLHVSWWY